MSLHRRLARQRLSAADGERARSHAFAAVTVAVLAILGVQLDTHGAATRRASVQVSARVNPVACPAGTPKLRSCVYPVRKLEAAPSSEATARSAPAMRVSNPSPVSYRVLEY